MSNVWSAWSRKEFDASKYVYHYTTFETALKILYSDKFRFSSLSRTNDTSEQKLRIRYAFPIGEKLKADRMSFEKYWLEWATHSKLLCFSQDTEKQPNIPCPEITDIFDVRGRGFALPRMWAQYAKNNSGMCFILKKNILVDKVKEFYPEAICKSVSYYDWSAHFDISEELFRKFVKIIEHNPKSGHATTFLQENPEFAEYSFFSKLKDWEGEKEYRILLPNSDEGYLYIEGVKEQLAGVVLGEQMEEAQVWLLSEILPSTIPLRQISFELNRCELKHIKSKKSHE